MPHRSYYYLIKSDARNNLHRILYKVNRRNQKIRKKFIFIKNLLIAPKIFKLKFHAKKFIFAWQSELYYTQKKMKTCKKTGIIEQCLGANVVVQFHAQEDYLKNAQSNLG